MAVDKSLMSGSMTMLLLRLLAEKDMYGYEMIDTLRKKSCNVFELKAGTLYPLLHGLEAKGLLTVYEQEYAGKTRKYYSITKEGRKLLKQKKRSGWNINPRSPVFWQWGYKDGDIFGKTAVADPL